ncbi:group-specific protein [Paenibacillus xylanilyticus]|uniref:group-specific protein n=1 Tax=Paenibacillus xylanilyticus TaxID=248903 RepID=UPI001FE4C9BE|nr:group-specific protein [Paenibacillus xylanilyticus]
MEDKAMISFQINETEVKKLCRLQFAELVREVDAEYGFWDSNELKKRTCWSCDTIQDTFTIQDSSKEKSIVNGFSSHGNQGVLGDWLLEQGK